MVQGGLSNTTRTCGKPGCRCHQGQRQGLYLYLTFRTMGGRASTLYVPRGAERQVRRAVQAWAAFRETGWDYFPMAACRGCPGKTQCRTPGELAGEPRRRVSLIHFRKPKGSAGNAGTRWRRQREPLRDEREGAQGGQTGRHGRRRARSGGRGQGSLPVGATAQVPDLQRLAKLLAPGRRRSPQAA